MTEIREGMRVVDDSGAEIGIVAQFKVGDPDAVTAAGQHGEAHGPVGILALAVASDEPRVPDGLAIRLRRTGYIKIHNDEAVSRDTYAAGDEIADVNGEVVRLAIGGEWLATEQ
jgi:hypothetical protein